LSRRRKKGFLKVLKAALGGLKNCINEILAFELEAFFGDIDENRNHEEST